VVAPQARTPYRGGTIDGRAEMPQRARTAGSGYSPVPVVGVSGNASPNHATGTPCSPSRIFLREVVRHWRSKRPSSPVRRWSVRRTGREGFAFLRARCPAIPQAVRCCRFKLASSSAHCDLGMHLRRPSSHHRPAACVRKPGQRLGWPGRPPRRPRPPVDRYDPAGCGSGPPRERPDPRTEGASAACR